jgi:glycosyltransferase involved in cell wall biosynthesis
VSEADHPKPRVALGLAVYNGEEFLAQAIQSIVDQSFTDFECVVSDNASTDRTAEIAQSFAAQDPRIRYSKNATNIGGARNENLTVSLTSAAYFRWAAHDDYLEPTLLERCVEVLDRDPGVVICYTQVRQLDLVAGTSTILSRNNASSRRPATRFRRIILSRDFLEETYGLIRRDVLDRTNLQADYTASDRTLMAEISLYGRFYEVPEPLFVKRLHPKNAYVDWRTRIAWFRPGTDGMLSFPWWAQLGDLLRTVRRAQVGGLVQAECYAAVALWAFVRAPNLAKDVIEGALGAARGRAWRQSRYAASKNWE